MNLYNYVKQNKPNEEEVANFFKIKKEKEENIEKIFVIGDIHGELDLLKKLLQIIPSNSKIYLVGDIIEKGSKSLETLFFIMKNKEKFNIVIGNHELRMLTYLIRIIKNNDVNNIWYKKNLENNDNEIVKYFKQNKNKIKQLYSFFEEHINLGYFINNKFLITHGYALPFAFKKNTKNIDIIKNRELNNNNKLNNNIINIFGHLGTGEFKQNNLICLDDSVYKTGKLVYINLKDLELKKVYKKKKENYLDLSTKTNL